jgi:hypothetical protein
MSVILPYAFIHALVFTLYVFSVIASNFFSFLSSLDKASPVLQTVSITKSVYLMGVPLLMLAVVRNGENDGDWLQKQQKITPKAYFDQFNNWK